MTAVHPSFPSSPRRGGNVPGWILALALLAVPSSAFAATDKMPAATEAVVSDIAVKIDEGELVVDPLRYQKRWPIEYVAGDDGDRSGGFGKKTDDLPDPKVQGRPGAGPWRLFEGVIPESKCRSPRLSQNGSTVMAICAGLDVGRPSDEHVVVQRGGRVLRYHEPIFRLEGRGDEAEMSPDGRRVAVLAGVGGGRSIHLLDLDAMTDTRITGGWTEPRAPSIDADVQAVAFTATVKGKAAAVVVNLDDGSAKSWRSAKNIDVRGLGFRGRRVLVIAEPVDIAQAMLVDVAENELFDLSERKGDVSSARMLPSGATVTFTTEVGGACVVYTAELARRVRRELVSSVDHCFDRIFPEEQGRFLLWDRVYKRDKPKVTLYDKKKKRVHWELYDSCDRATINPAGRLVAAQCGNRKLPPAVYLFLVPEQPTVDKEGE